eukprot:scaffold98949_cov66-Phaeocystis_antarctica.AAC.6
MFASVPPRPPREYSFKAGGTGERAVMASVSGPHCASMMHAIARLMGRKKCRITEPPLKTGHLRVIRVLIKAGEPHTGT